MFIIYVILLEKIKFDFLVKRSLFLFVVKHLTVFNNLIFIFMLVLGSSRFFKLSVK